MDGILGNISECVNVARDRAYFFALTNLLANMKKRIFEEGKASDGSLIGRYQLIPGRHRRKRVANNRQVGYVDLFFDGDLAKSVQVFKIDGNHAIAFSFRKFRLIAEGNEGQRKKKIFAPTDEEVQEAILDVGRFFKEEFLKCLNDKR